MSAIRYIGLAATFSACSLSLSAKYAGPAPRWSIVGAPTACATSASGFFLSTDAVNALLRGNRMAEVKVVLQSGATKVATQAQYIAEARTFRVPVPAGLQTGGWDVVIQPQGLGETRLQRALDIVEAPVIESVSARAICSSSTGQSVFVVRGQRLSNTTTVALDGLASSELTVSVRDDGGLDVVTPIAALDKGRVYPVVASNAAGCEARFEDGIVVVDPPVPTGLVAGPVLRDGVTVPPGAAFTVRVSGTAIVTGSAFEIGGVAALRTRAGPTAGSVDADFASLPAGDHRLNVHNGGCSAEVPGTVAISGALPIGIVAANPQAVTPLGLHYVDLSTTLSAAVSAAAVPSFFVDVDPDPFVADWRALAVELDLDGDRRLWRTSSPSFSLFDSAFLDVRAEAQSAADALVMVEGYAPGGLFALGTSDFAGATPEEAAMRLVWKDRDSAMVGERVYVYGCFSPEVSAELVAMDTVLGQASAEAVASLLVRGNAPAEAWAASKYRCLRANSAPVTRMLELEIPSGVAPGAYRIRLRDSRATASEALGSVALVADDLYPFVVYDATPTLSAFSFATQVGGGLLELTVGRKLAASALASDGSGRKFFYVMGGDQDGTPVSSPQDVGTANSTYEFSPVTSTHELAGFTALPLTAAASAPGDVAHTYGMLALADGASVYLVGGTSNGTSTIGEIRRALVTDALDDAANAGRLQPFTKVGQLQTSGAVEVKSYGHSGAILRSGSSSTFERSVVVVRGIEDKTVPYVASDVVLSAPLDPSSGFGDLTVVASLDAASRGQAFAASVMPTLDSLQLFFGYAAPTNASTTNSTDPIDNTNNRFHTNQSFTAEAVSLSRGTAALIGVFDTAVENTATMNLPEVGLFSLSAGPKSFLLGGIDVDTIVALNDGAIDLDDELNPNQPIDRILRLDGALGTTIGNKLLARRAYSAAVFLAPQYFVVSGVVCTSDEDDPTTRASCALPSKKSISVRMERVVVR